MPQHLQEIAVGMLLGDASIYQVSTEAYIKFEQGYQQSDFVHHLCALFSTYCFMQQPPKGSWGKGSATKKEGSGFLWFKTFSHKSFTELQALCFVPQPSLIIVCNSSEKRLIPKGLTEK